MARWLALNIHSHFGISRGITNIPTAIILKLRCKLSNELKCRLLSRALSRGGGSFLFGKKAVTSIRRAVVYSLTGAIFNWEKERIQDWEMNECLSNYKKDNGKVQSHQPAPDHSVDCPLDKRREGLPDNHKMLSVQRFHEKAKCYLKKLHKSIESYIKLPCLNSILPHNSSFRDVPLHIYFLYYLLLPHHSLLPSVPAKLPVTNQQDAPMDAREDLRCDDPSNELLKMLLKQNSCGKSKEFGNNLNKQDCLQEDGHTSGDSVPGMVQERDHSRGTNVSPTALDRSTALKAEIPEHKASSQQEHSLMEKAVEKVKGKIMEYSDTPSWMKDDEFFLEDTRSAECTGNVLGRHLRGVAERTEWNPLLDAPPVDLREYLPVHEEKIAYAITHIASLSQHNYFVPIFGESAFTDAFLAFGRNEVVGFRRVSEGVLFELGSVSFESSNATTPETLMSDEVIFNLQWIQCAEGQVPKPKPELEWKLILTKGNCKLYSRPHLNTSHKEYRVTGEYDDVTAANFIEVQVDPVSRQHWDRYFASITQIDRDPLTGTEIIHWVAQPPFPLKSRDYVLVRRIRVMEEGKSIVMINRASNHPSYPETSQHVRVDEYISKMIVRSKKHVTECGLEFELMYMDDIKCTLPQSIANWAASSGVPDFIDKVHWAALMRQSNSNKDNLINSISVS